MKKVPEFYVHIDFIDEDRGKYWIRVTSPDNQKEYDAFGYTAQTTKNGSLLRGFKLRRELEKMVAERLSQ